MALRRRVAWDIDQRFSMAAYGALIMTTAEHKQWIWMALAMFGTSLQLFWPIERGSK